MARGEYTSVGRGGHGHGGHGHGGHGHHGHGHHGHGHYGRRGWGGWGGWGYGGGPHYDAAYLPYYASNYYLVPLEVTFPHWQSPRFFLYRNRRRIHYLLGAE